MPNIAVVEEAVVLLLFEFDLMGNLQNSYSFMDKVDDPIMFKEKNEQLDELDLALSIQMNRGDVDDEQNVEQDPSGTDISNTCTLIDPVNNGDLNTSTLINKVNEDVSSTSMPINSWSSDILLEERIDNQLAKAMDVPENADMQDESEINKKFEEFEPMDYLCIKSVPSRESNDIPICEENVKENSPENSEEAMNLDLLLIKSVTTDGDIGNENNINDQEIDCYHTEQLLEETTSDYVDPLLIVEKKIDNKIDKKSVDSTKKPLSNCISLINLESSEASDESYNFRRKVSKNYKYIIGSKKILKKRKRIISVSSTSTLSDEERNFSESNNMKKKFSNAKNNSSINDSNWNDDKEKNNEDPRKIKTKPCIMSMKDKEYNIRKRKAEMIMVSLDLGSDIKVSSSSSEEESSWSGTFGIESNDDCESNSSGWSQESLCHVSTRYNLRSR